MTNASWLNKLQEQLKIDIDCMDPAEAKKLLPFKPSDQTSNQRLVYEQMISPENRELFLQTAKEAKDDGWEVILNRMSARLCAKNIEIIDGRVLLQSSARFAYDTEKVIEHARAYAHEFEKAGISKDRICIKIPATGPALNASPILPRGRHSHSGHYLFSVAQAIAASQAGCLSISPYINFPWYHADRKQWPDVQDPALKHPMSNRLVQIKQVYERLHEETGKKQPLLKPASFISPQEAMAMGELGCEHARIPENILLELSLLDAEANPPAGSGSVTQRGIIAPRLRHLANSDPLAGDKWSGLPSTDVDCLANNGAALTNAIAEDETTARGLREALAAFDDNELHSRKAIEELLKQL